MEKVVLLCLIVAIISAIAEISPAPLSRDKAGGGLIDRNG
jgi:hypothetical protein